MPVCMICIAVLILSAPQTVMPAISFASSTFSHGTMQCVIPRSFASATMGKIPAIGFVVPSSPTSPKISKSLSSRFFPYAPESMPSAASTAMAIGRSNPEPDFRIFAGVKFTVIRFGGSRYPLFFNAVRTRSLDSFTSDAKNPTISNIGSPSLTSASTRTGIL